MSFLFCSHLIGISDNPVYLDPWAGGWKLVILPECVCNWLVGPLTCSHLSLMKFRILILRRSENSHWFLQWWFMQKHILKHKSIINIVVSEIILLNYILHKGGVTYIGNCQVYLQWIWYSFMNKIFQSEVGPNHVHCRKSVNIRDIPKFIRKGYWCVTLDRSAL